MTADDVLKGRPPFPEFNVDKALIFRITHRDNLPWILDHGLHCQSSPIQDPQFVAIGNPDLIAKRRHLIIDRHRGRPLIDYIPFYFTPRSPMMLNVLTGHNGVRQQGGHDIVVIVASLREIAASGISVLFTDRHSNHSMSRIYDDPCHLQEIDWEILQWSDFRRDPDDPDKFARYQAEALVHRVLTVDRISGFACYDEESKGKVVSLLDDRGLNMPVVVQRRWYDR